MSVSYQRSDARNMLFFGFLRDFIYFYTQRDLKITVIDINNIPNISKDLKKSFTYQKNPFVLPSRAAVHLVRYV